jgi:hypothetical protein
MTNGLVKFCRLSKEPWPKGPSFLGQNKMGFLVFYRCNGFSDLSGLVRLAGYPKKMGFALDLL